MTNSMLVKECQRLQGLLEDAFRHLGRVADFHPLHTGVELRQLFNKGVHAGTHGLKHQTLMDAIGAIMLEHIKKLCDMSRPFCWGNCGNVAQDLQLFCVCRCLRDKYLQGDIRTFAWRRSVSLRERRDRRR